VRGATGSCDPEEVLNYLRSHHVHNDTDKTRKLRHHIRRILVSKTMVIAGAPIQSVQTNQTSRESLREIITLIDEQILKCYTKDAHGI